MLKTSPFHSPEYGVPFRMPDGFVFIDQSIPTWSEAIAFYPR